MGERGLQILAQHLAARLSRQTGREISLGRPALEQLLAYPFPGNVRELENLLESAAAVSTENPQVLTEKHLKPLLQRSGGASGSPLPGEQPLSMDRLEHVAIQQALRLCQGNRTKAASMLGISRDTLYRKLRQSRADG